ncbi:MAG: serine hydrolase domain-containing protein [Meiothermus sp.]|nr:serine hydrolase domain-containing protein [Meiothermus sp.]
MSQAELERQLRAAVDNPNLPLSSLAVAVIKGGELAYINAFGHRRFDPDLPANLDSRYRVASISKLVMSLGVMKLWEGGQLELDRDVGDYLGFPLRNPAFPEAPITARMLLNHTGSLRDGNLYSIPTPYTLRDFFLPEGRFYNSAEHFEAAHPPGAFFCYTNLSFGVLGTVIERVTGRRFDLYMEDEILRPLGIGGGYNITRLPEADNLATLYRKLEGDTWNPAGAWQPQVDDWGGQPPTHIRLQNPDVGGDPRVSVDLEGYVIGSNATFFSPQGGLRASVKELVKVAQLFLNRGAGLLRPETLEAMLAEEWTYDGGNGDTHSGLMRSWGLSVQRFLGVKDAEGGDLLADRGGLPLYYGHLGDAYGLLSCLAFDPKHRNALIYIVGGVGNDPFAVRGGYSRFTPPEEAVLTALYGLL